MGDFATESSVQHHEHLQLLDIVDENFTKSIWEDMSRGFSIPVTDLGHLQLASEAPSDTVVNTPRLAPVGLNG